MQFAMKKENKFLNFMVGVLALVMSLSLLVVGCTLETQTPDTELQPSPEPTPEPAPEEADDEVVEVNLEKEDSRSDQEVAEEEAALLVADGTYTDRVEYQNPSGSDEFDITVTVENDVVQDISLIGIDPHPVSSNYINGVAGEIADLVVGKNIGDIELPKQISGSSLTTAAVQNYLDDLPDKY